MFYFSDRRVQKLVKNKLEREHMNKVNRVDELERVLQYYLEGGPTRDHMNALYAYIEYSFCDISLKEKDRALQILEILNESFQLFQLDPTRELLAYSYAIADWL